MKLLRALDTEYGKVNAHKFVCFTLSKTLRHLPGGGVLSGKVGTGMCGPDRVLFRALRFIIGPFFI